MIGVARSPFSNEAFRADLAKSLPKFATRDIDERVVKRVLGCVAYVQGDPDDDETYKKIGRELDAHRARARHARATGCSIWRRRRPALPRSAAISANPAWRARTTALGGASSSRSRSAPISPPRARSIKSCSAFSKRTRFSASTIISARRRCRTSWCCASPTDCSSRSGIAITSTMCRSRSRNRSTVGRRGSYYDATGALRDMVPNHLFQLLSLIAMEPPSRFAADAVRAEKAQVLDAIQLPGPRRSAAQCGARAIWRRLYRQPCRSKPIARPRTSSPTAPRKPMSRSS